MSKNPLLAGILSLIIPGLGYVYMGKVITGLIVMVTFFATVILVLYSYFYHSVFSGIPELAFINLWPFFYFIWIPLAYDIYRTVKKENKIKIMENSEINEKINEDIKDELICPECGFENTKNVEYCINCGRDLRDTLFYACGDVSIINASDIEITNDQLIE